MLSLGSQSANAHVHWHDAPLPEGTPLEQQQYYALMHENGVIDTTPSPEANRSSNMPPNEANPNEGRSVAPGEWLRLGLVHVSVPLTLLLCGGDAGWWQAWTFSLLIVAAGVGGRAWAEWRHPGLMAERERTRSLKTSDIKSWDKILGPLMALTLSFPPAIVAGLDHRFAWSPVFPIWLNAAGILLIAAGFAFASWALAENRFFSTLMRIQTDRGHTVCDTGPYRIVRHPGYAGNVLAAPGIVLALGSLWTLVPVGIALVVAVIRTALEDRTLQAELPGYREYTTRVKYRLLPGIY